MTQHVSIPAVPHSAEATPAVPRVPSAGALTTRPSVPVLQALLGSRGQGESAELEVRLRSEAAPALAPGPCAHPTRVEWTRSATWGVTGAGERGQCAPARGDTGVTRWSSVAEESASVTASVLTTRPALTTDARIPARAQTPAAASTPTAGLSITPQCARVPRATRGTPSHPAPPADQETGTTITRLESEDCVVICIF